MWRSVALALMGLSPLAAFAEHPSFAPISAPPHIYSGGWEHFVGGGLAAFDCDGDQLPELLLAGGDAPMTFLRNESKPGEAVSFVTDTPPELALTGVTGAYPLDIDGDGQLDLAILRVGANALLKGLPNCVFTNFTDIALVEDDRWTTAFSASWEQDATLPTLAFGNYVDRTDPDGPFGTCDVNHLYRPHSGTYPPPLALEPGYCPLSMLFSDWGRQGRADLRVSNDRHYYVKDGQEQMWAMEPTPRLFTEADAWVKFQLWGMGIASRDITGDGLPEVYLTSMGDQRLQRLIPDANGPRFADAPFSMGTAAHRPYTGDDGRPSTGWQVSFGDVQNDGLDDIFVTKGNVEQMPGSAMKDPNNLLVQQLDGTFLEVGDRANLASMHRARGAVLSDFNLDGLLDVAVNNRRAPLEIYQNTTTNTGHWIGLDLRQDGPNTRAVGAWIEVDTGRRVYAREMIVGGGHAGGVSVPEHFGLGEADDIRVRVIWSKDEVSEWRRIAPNAYYQLTRRGDDFSATPY